MDDNFMGRIRHGLRFATAMSGPAGFLQSAAAFARSRPDLEYPDIQLHFGAFAFDVTPTGITMLHRPAVTLQPDVNNTRSRGHMELRPADPAEPPRIHANMPCDPQHVDTLIARRALATRAIAPELQARPHRRPVPTIDRDQMSAQGTRVYGWESATVTDRVSGLRRGTGRKPALSSPAPLPVSGDAFG